MTWKTESMRTGFIDDFALKDVTHQSSAVIIWCFVKCTNNYPDWFTTFISHETPLSCTHTHTHCTHARPHGKSTTSVPWGTNNHILPCCSQFCRIYSTNICNVTTMQGWGWHSSTAQVGVSCVWERYGGPRVSEKTVPFHSERAQYSLGHLC